MLHRVTGALATAALVMAGLVVTPPAPALAEGSLDVPAEPSGDVPVTATADSGSHPYVQVKLTRPGLVGEPYSTMTAIPTPPVRNTGEAVDVLVPSWGLGDGAAATFVLLGCSGPDGSACTSLLATEERTIDQTTVEPMAYIHSPGDGAMLIPPQGFTLSERSGHGRLTATVYGERHDVEDEAALTALLDDPQPGGSNFGRVIFPVARCSDLARDETFCEPPFDYVHARFLREIPPVVLDRPSRAFTMDPTWSSASQVWRIRTETLGLVNHLSWEIREPGSDAVIVGPVDAGTSQQAEERVLIDPANHTDVLPDGEYDLVMKASVRKAGDLSLSDSTVTRIRVTNDPPTDHPTVREAERLVRNDYRDSRTAHFVVDAYDDEAAEIVLRDDSTGADVLHQEVRESDYCRECSTALGYEFALHPYGDDNHRIDNGHYTARLRMNDSWGRPVVVPLGKVYAQATRPGVVRARVRPAAVRLRGTRVVGRCSRLSRPDPARVRGSLWFRSLARCDSTRGKRDLVQQVLKVRIPEPRGDVATIDNAFVQFQGWARGRGVARATCRLGRESRDGHRVRIPGLEWSYLCGTGFREGWEQTPKVARLRFRAVRGRRLDVRRLRVVVAYNRWYTPR